MRIQGSGGQGPENVPPAEHTIQEGETLESIAKQYNVSTEALLNANPILNTGITPGQIIQIPNVPPPPPENSVQSDALESGTPNLFERLVPRELLRAGPPYVPVKMLNESLEESGTPPEKQAEVTLSPDELQINDQGQLVISNPELVEYFKTLMQNGSGQTVQENVRLQISGKKVEEENS